MIVSGGAVRNEYSEAQTMKEYALTRGIPAATLIVEDKSRNTFGNLKCIRDLLKERGWKSVILVTSAYHTRRVSLLNKHYFRLEAVLHPVRYPPEVKWHQVLYNIYAEYVLILRSKLVKHREFKEAE
jgi:SanA protein